MKKKIKVAIAGVGNCASALIQGIQYYSSKPSGILLTTKDNGKGFSIILI